MIPHGVAFGYLVDVGELLIGIALIATAVLWLARWRRLTSTWRYIVLAAIIASSAVAIFMNVNFHFANTPQHPWLIPEDVFDEGVDVDSLLPIIEAVFIAVAVWTWIRLRRQERRSPER